MVNPIRRLSSCASCVSNSIRFIVSRRELAHASPMSHRAICELIFTRTLLQTTQKAWPMVSGLLTALFPHIYYCTTCSFPQTPATFLLNPLPLPLQSTIGYHGKACARKEKVGTEHSRTGLKGALRKSTASSGRKSIPGQRRITPNSIGPYALWKHVEGHAPGKTPPPRAPRLIRFCPRRATARARTRLGRESQVPN